VVTHPIQYFAPLFRILAAEPGLELMVYYGSGQGTTTPVVDPGFEEAFTWDVPLLEGYRYRFLPALRRDSPSVSPTRQVNPSIVKEISRTRHDAVVVHGYTENTYLLAMLTAFVKRVPILMRGESHLRREPLPTAKRLAKSAALRALFSQVAGFLCIGTLNKEYYRYFGVPETRLFHCPYSVDNEFFRRHAEAPESRRLEIRARWGIHDDTPVILFAGKLLPRKQPLLLLEAYRRVRQGHRCALLLAGDGPLRGEIESEIEKDAIPDVHITGFLNQTEMPLAYAAADLFVLPSRHETWGLVVNEAMNFSLPIIVSDRVGCGPDLVRQGVNGEVFDHRSVNALESVLGRLIGEPACLSVLGHASLQIIQGWGLRETAKGIAAAVEAVTRNLVGSAAA